MPIPRSEQERSTTAGALALLALVITRISCSFQFQSVSLLAPFLADRLDVAVTEFGVLLGIYMAPGFFTAIATPWMTTRLGRHGTLQIALALMALGQGLLAFAPSFWLACVGRLISGMGGCVIYIATVDLAARQAGAGALPFRMGTIAASWPAGNALALVVLGVIAANGAYFLTGLLPIGLVALASLTIALAFLLLGRTQSTVTAPSGALANGLGRWRLALRNNLAIALSFAAYNVGFIILTSFSPTILTEAGYAAAAAAQLASVPMWIFLLSVPLGGILASAAPYRHGPLVLVGLLGSALALVLSAFIVDKELCYFAAGFLGGLPTGPMLARVGRTDFDGKHDDLAYSALFLIFFTALLIVPPLAGAAIEWSGDARSVLWLVAVLLLVAVALFHFTGPAESQRSCRF